MEKIDIKQMVRLNHMLYLKHFAVKLRNEGDFDVYISPMNKDYDPDKNIKMFDIITDFYKKQGYDVMIDHALMCYHLYKK